MRCAELPSVYSVSSAAGSASLTVRGTGFTPALDGPWCRVGSFGPLTAQWLGPSLVSCPLPLLGGSTAARIVQVSNNGADYSVADDVEYAPAGADQAWPS